MNNIKNVAYNAVYENDNVLSDKIRDFLFEYYIQEKQYEFFAYMEEIIPTMFNAMLNKICFSDEYNNITEIKDMFLGDTYYFNVVDRDLYKTHFYINIDNSVQQEEINSEIIRPITKIKALELNGLFKKYFDKDITLYEFAKEVYDDTIEYIISCIESLVKNIDLEYTIKLANGLAMDNKFVKVMFEGEPIIEKNIHGNIYYERRIGVSMFA